MTSEKPKPIAPPATWAAFVVVVMLTMAGCQTFKSMFGGKEHTRSISPYAQAQVWAVAPLRNESGSRYAAGADLADELAHQITLVRGLETVPVNRVLAAMDSLKLKTIRSREDALKLRKALNVDGLVIGTISAWDPYDPPKIGLALDLYLDPLHPSRKLDTRRLTRAATEPEVIPSDPYRVNDQPVSAVSGFYDAADPITRKKLNDYAVDRGFAEDDPHPQRLYRLSMSLYSQFASHLITRRLLASERRRLTPPSAAAAQTGPPPRFAAAPRSGR